VSKRYLARGGKSGAVTIKETQRIVDAAADKEAAPIGPPGNATEAVRHLQRLQPPRAAFTDGIAQDVLRRLGFDALSVGAVETVVAAGQNQHLALVRADRDRSCAIGDI
jgi:hypothetical protein